MSNLFPNTEKLSYKTTNFAISENKTFILKTDDSSIALRSVICIGDDKPDAFAIAVHCSRIKILHYRKRVTSNCICSKTFSSIFIWKKICYPH